MRETDNIPWDSHIIDLEDAMARVMGHKEMYKGWLNSFFSDENFSSITAAFDAKDSEAAHRSLHKLKGTAGNLSVLTVYEQARLMDEKVKLNATFEELQPDYEKLREDFYYAKKMFLNNINIIMDFHS